jgi:hypothetical protein
MLDIAAIVCLLIIVCQDTVLIRYSSEAPVQQVKVAPGECLWGYIYMYGKQALPASHTKKLTLPTGSCVTLLFERE